MVGRCSFYPFGHCVDTPVNSSSSKTTIKNFLGETRDCLDDAVHGHEDAKQKIMQFIAQTISNKSPHGLVLGIEGPMGNGKTTLVEKGFAKALKRPFITIPLGGFKMVLSLKVMVILMKVHVGGQLLILLLYLGV